MKKHVLYLVYLVLDKEVLYDTDINWIKPFRETIPNEDDTSIRFVETIYAVSDDKVLLEDFLSFRNKKKFRIEKVEFTCKEDINKAKLEYTNILMKVEEVGFKMGINDFSYISMPTTTSEMEILECYVEEYETDMFDIVSPDYRAFKREYIEALDILVYTYFHAVLASDEDLAVSADSCMGSGFSPEGFVKATGRFSYKFLDSVGFLNGILKYVIS